MQKRQGKFGIFRAEEQLGDFGRLHDDFRTDLYKVWRRGVRRPHYRTHKIYPDEVNWTEKLIAERNIRPDEPYSLDGNYIWLSWEVREEAKNWPPIDHTGRTGILPWDLSTHIAKTRSFFEQFGEDHLPEEVAQSEDAMCEFGWRCFATVIAEAYGKKP